VSQPSSVKTGDRRTLVELVRKGAKPEELEQLLDGLDHAARYAECVALTGADQAKLFELSAGRGCTIAGDFVPESVGTLVEVIHHGKNSLPVFKQFQKRFARPKTPHVPPAAVGYNEQTMRAFTGPGFFVAREERHESGEKTVVIDYTRLPDEKVATWPEILPNTARLSRFIYNGTQDWMWRVSKHVTIGRARRASGWMDNWFVLCREER
jgi:hypothetical protein